MKRLLHLITYILVLLPATAQTIVRDASDGQPVIQASADDEQATHQPQPRLETGQRKGKLLVMLHDYAGQDSLMCSIKCSGNLVETDYNVGKVLSINGELLRPGDAVVAIVSRQTGDTIATSHTYIRMVNATLELDEVVAVGSKKKLRPLNPYNREPPRGYKPGDPKIEQAANMQQLLTSLGIRITYQGSDPYITTPDNAGLNIYVDNMRIDADEHDYVLNSIVPANVKAVEYFTPNSAENGIFGVRPASFSGKVPGVLFIFLKDGSETVHP